MGTPQHISALLRVTHNLLIAANGGLSSFMVLLDLSAAFDTVEQAVLIDHLRHWCGVSETALNWFKSYIRNRTFFVSVNNSSSTPAYFLSGVPQVSVLGPLLFSIYMFLFVKIIQNHNLSFHCYVDITQLYLPI